MSTPLYLVPGDTPDEQNHNKRFWDVVLTDMINGDYNKLCNLLQTLSKLTLAFVPTREDLHTEFKEHVDIIFLKQKFELKVFSLDDFVNLFSYWIDWSKRIGAPADDDKLESLKEQVSKTAQDKGYLYILPYCYDKLYNHLAVTYNVAQDLKKKIKGIKN